PAGPSACLFEWPPGGERRTTRARRRPVDRHGACLDARARNHFSRSAMKMLLAFALVAGLSGAALAADKTETLKVSGWHCAGCSAKTESALKDLKGVTSASADKTKKEVTVTYDDTKVKHADLEKAIADAGFSVEKKN